MVLKLGGVLENKILNLGQDLLTNQSGVGVNPRGTVLISRKKRIRTSLNLIGLITEETGQVGHYRWLAKGLVVYAAEFSDKNIKRGLYESAKNILLVLDKPDNLRSDDRTLIENIALCLSTRKYTLDSSVVLPHRTQTLKGDTLADKAESIADSMDNALRQMPQVSYRRNKMQESFVALRSIHRQLVLDLRNIAIEERGTRLDYGKLEMSLRTLAGESTAEEAKKYIERAEYNLRNDMEKALKIIDGDDNQNLGKLRLAQYYVNSFLESYDQPTRFDLQWAGIISLRLARVTGEQAHFEEAYHHLKESYQGENDVTLRFLSEATSRLVQFTGNPTLREEARGYEACIAEKDKIEEVSLDPKVDRSEWEYCSIIPSNVWGKNREEEFYL